MSVSVGAPAGPEELAALSDVLDRTYLRSPEDAARWRDEVDPDTLRVVRSDGAITGGLRLLRAGQWFGGRIVPMTGIAAVAIDPERRGAGLGGELMRHTLDELHGEGVALSALYPATVPVYRRAGWEHAGTWTVFAVPCEAIDGGERSLDLRRVDPQAISDTIRTLYDRRAAATQGHLDRPQDMWDRRLGNRGDEVHAYTVGPHDEPEGYVLFTQKRQEGWKYDLNCSDLIALTPRAARRLWSFFADHRSFARRVAWWGHPSDPHLYGLREQPWDETRHWTWMQRIVDVRAALEARGYPSGVTAELHLEVTDETLPANARRLVLSVDGTEAKVTDGGTGDLRADIRGLATLYTSFASPLALRHAGLLDGTDGALATAATVFSGPAPWLPDFF